MILDFLYYFGSVKYSGYKNTIIDTFSMKIMVLSTIIFLKNISISNYVYFNTYLPAESCYISSKTSKYLCLMIFQYYE